MADPTPEDRTICTLKAASWLWRIEARRLTRGFSVVISDEDSGGLVALRERLAKDMDDLLAVRAARGPSAHPISGSSVADPGGARWSPCNAEDRM